MTSQALDRMDDIRGCPRCSTSVIVDLQAKFGQCARCFFAFCIECGSNYHPGSQCVGLAEKVMDTLSKPMGSGADEMRRRQRLQQELMNLETIGKTAKQCPSCGNAVEKSEGCNKMTCRCGQLCCDVMCCAVLCRL